MLKAKALLVQKARVLPRENFTKVKDNELILAPHYPR
jgi:hypothetical protein